MKIFCRYAITLWYFDANEREAACEKYKNASKYTFKFYFHNYYLYYASEFLVVTKEREAWSLVVHV